MMRKALSADGVTPPACGAEPDVGQPAPSQPLAVRIRLPQTAGSWLVVASPHSGQHYPADMLARAQLDVHRLRRAEDAWVDELFAAAPQLGAPLVCCDYARAYVDLNRARDELDPLLVDGLTGDGPAQRTLRVVAGLGVVPRSVGDSELIYAGRIPAADVERRLAAVYDPYHAALSGLLATARARHGASLLLDCHSMPKAAAGGAHVDVVLGDRFGASCHPRVTSEAAAILKQQGLNVVRNAPYAGGHATCLHGRPGGGSHALQIELNRSLYMVEGAHTRRTQFAAISAAMSRLIEGLADLGERLQPKASAIWHR